MTETTYDFDVLVVGGGHAGVEAAMAAARMGAGAALLTGNLDTIAQMSCNPAIGGVAKGQIVREVDALGGVMGLATDATALQFRMLNQRKGPAVQGPRAQTDRRAYQIDVKHRLELQPNLTLRQETVDELLVDAEGRAVGVRVLGDVVYRASSVVLSAGTFMQGVLHYGNKTTPGGRAGEGSADGMSRSLAQLGFRLERFKTGTPPRLNGRTIDFSQTERQPGDQRPRPFSFLNDTVDYEQLPCWITHTNPAVHELIRANLGQAPMYTGQIQSTGPRYCPSVETKVVRFAEKDRHQIFLEPEGRQTTEIYANGLSTSLPRNVQDAILREIPALAKAQIVRYGYAIEYDFLPPDQLKPSLETKLVAGLFLAGQINGTTGYEEAAAQGLLAGANAALRLAGAEPLVLARHEGYLGVMVDDLVTRGVDEPYRMFTSRAEYRLRLRQDNADRRLTPIGHRLGLVDRQRFERLQKKEAEIARVSHLLETTHTAAGSLAKRLRRPETTWSDLAERLPELAAVSTEVAEQVSHDTKYAGYMAREDIDIRRQERLSARRIPESIDFMVIDNLRMEARERLDHVRPTDLAHASRIRGITPADMAVLTVYLQSLK